MTPLLWLSDEDQGHCVLEPADIPDAPGMYTGKSVEAAFPSDLTYKMSDRFPDDLLLSDNFNVAAQIVVSASLKEVLVKELPGHRIEWLPVSIINHKGRVESADYFILHSLDVVDCIDVDKSKVTWHPLDKKTIYSSKGLVVDASKIPAKLKLFRPQHWGMNTMVDAALADRLSTAGFSGLYFMPADGFTGIA